MNKRSTAFFLRAALAVAFACPAVSFAAASAVSPDFNQGVAGTLPVRITAASGAQTDPAFSGANALEVRGKRDEQGSKNRISRKERPLPEDADGLPESGGPGSVIVIRGSVRITGNDPHTVALVEDASTGEIFSVTPAETMERVRGLQGETVDFTVRLLDEPPAGEGKGASAMRTVNPLSWKIVR